MTNKQTIWVKNEDSLVSILNAIWKQWGSDIAFSVEQDGNGYIIHFNS